MPEIIPPIPEAIVITLAGTLYPAPFNTPIACAFSAPITNTANGMEQDKTNWKLNSGTTILGAIKEISPMFPPNLPVT